MRGGAAARVRTGGCSLGKTSMERILVHNSIEAGLVPHSSILVADVVDFLLSVLKFHLLLFDLLGDVRLLHLKSVQLLLQLERFLLNTDDLELTIRLQL